MAMRWSARRLRPAATDGERTAEPIPCHVEYASCLARQIQATRLFWKFRERTNLNLEKAAATPATLERTREKSTPAHTSFSFDLLNIGK